MQSNSSALPSHSTVEQKVSRSLVALIIRQVLAYGALFLGNVFLSRWLSQDDYGIFAAAFAFQAALVLLSDVGLGPALIQRAEKPTEEELRSLFTVQLVLFGVVTVGAWLFAPAIAELTEVGRQAAFLVQAMALVFLITAFRSIPAMLLERDLRFDAIALTETVSTVVYQGVLVTLVYFGFGLNSIVWALAARYGTDLLLIFMFYPWKPRLSGQVRLVWPYLRFGIGMQGVRLLAYVKDQVPLLALVPLLGAASAGEWGWALNYIAIPVYFNRLIDRIMFPAYARVQDNREAVGRLAGMGLWLNFVVGLPILVALVFFAPALIPLVYSSTWLTALPVAILLTPNMVASFVTGTAFPILYATGQTRRAVRFFALWVALTLITGMVGLELAGLNGLAAGYSVSTLVVSGIILNAVRPVAAVPFKESLLSPFVATLVALGGAGLLTALHLSWVVALAGAIGLYAATLLLLAGPRIRSLFQQGLVA